MLVYIALEIIGENSSSQYFVQINSMREQLYIFTYKIKFSISIQTAERIFVHWLIETVFGERSADIMDRYSQTNILTDFVALMLGFGMSSLIEWVCKCIWIWLSTARCSWYQQ